MNKEQQWGMYTLLIANLMGVSLLGKHTVGTLQWEALFWICSLSGVFCWSMWVAISRDYRPLAKFAYDATEELEHE